ncbi:MAG: D-alanyl-D-alanine carboxypeptidase [Lentisphaeria bacterium]|nr:D-alanyl-D-alanine carboxypeptidase [Lentisphaeria bacterium]
MDEITKTRWKVVTVLAGIVIAVHLVLICVFVSNGSSSSEKKEKKPSAAQPAQTVKKSAPPVYRYFVPSKNPLFGSPLDYSTALRGNLPAKTVPGSAGARSGIIVDMDTRRVLWEKNSSRPVPIASMAKMMTMLLVMEQLEKRPQIALNTPVTVTQTARDVPRTGVLYLAPGEKFTVQELMIATAVKSANDAATLLAEYFGGNVTTFVAMMNRKAQLLKLRQTSFINPCGLPMNKQNSLGSAANMVLLGEQLLQYPVVMQWCNIKSSSIRNGKTVFVNTNKLVNPRYPGVDGMKTGYIRAAGSCLTFSALRNGRRIMGCVTGFKSSRDRDYFCRRLIDWAYKQPGKVTAKR